MTDSLTRDVRGTLHDLHVVEYSCMFSALDIRNERLLFDPSLFKSSNQFKCVGHSRYENRDSGTNRRGFVWWIVTMVYSLSCDSV